MTQHKLQQQLDDLKKVVEELQGIVLVLANEMHHEKSRINYAYSKIESLEELCTPPDELSDDELRKKATQKVG